MTVIISSMEANYNVWGPCMGDMSPVVCNMLCTNWYAQTGVRDQETPIQERPDKNKKVITWISRQ